MGPAEVNVLRFGAFYNEGVSGARGHAPSNDKVWGAARVDGALCTFWGRRNGVLEFKLEDNVDAVADKYRKKTTRTLGDRYTGVTTRSTIDMLCPDLETQIGRYFRRAVRLETLNIGF